MDLLKAVQFIYMRTWFSRRNFKQPECVIPICNVSSSESERSWYLDENAEMPEVDDESDDELEPNCSRSDTSTNIEYNSVVGKKKNVLLKLGEEFLGKGSSLLPQSSFKSVGSMLPCENSQHIPAYDECSSGSIESLLDLGYDWEDVLDPSQSQESFSTFIDDSMVLPDLSDLSQTSVSASSSETDEVDDLHDLENSNEITEVN